MSVTENKVRNGNLTSSEIVRLTGIDKKNPAILDSTALEYVSEKNMERRLKRSLDTETSARPCTWGKLVEQMAFSILGTEYGLMSQETIVSERYPFWVGSPDGNKFSEPKTVYDIKCPYTLKSFCQLVDPLYLGLTGIDCINAIRNGYVDKDGVSHKKHKDGEKYYWQLVSNSILTKSRLAELIVYVPYTEDLETIREMARGTDEGLQAQYAWINWAQDNELPNIPKAGYYKDLNKILFEIPQEDQLFLVNKIELAGKYLKTQ